MQRTIIQSVGTKLRAGALVGFAIMIAASLPAQDDSTTINLTYTGTGTITETQTTYVNEYNRKEKSHDFATVQSTGKKEFTGSGYVEISGNFGRIKLPSAMVPLLSSSQEGWFNIQNLFMNEREITGLIRINALNKPKLRIDRITGGITLTGGFGSSFSGECQVVDPNAQRKF